MKKYLSLFFVLIASLSYSQLYVEPSEQGDINSEETMPYFPEEEYIEEVLEDDYFVEDEEIFPEIDYGSKNINLARRSLTQLPRELMFSDKVETLNLSVNGLYLIDLMKDKGVFSDVTDSSLIILSKLNNLRVLDLSFNGLNSIDLLPYYPNLELLNISVTNVENLPINITSYTNLKRLEAHTNRLKTLPEDIGDLKSLEYLDLRLTMLDKLPESIGGLVNLKYLDLNSSETLTILPNSIGDLKALEELYISIKNLKLVPATIGSLSNLKVLAMTDMTSLKKFPIAIYNLKKLETLYVSASDLKRWKIKLKKLQQELPNCKLEVL